MFAPGTVAADQLRSIPDGEAGAAALHAGSLICRDKTRKRQKRISQDAEVPCTPPTSSSTRAQRESIKMGSSTCAAEGAGPVDGNETAPRVTRRATACTVDRDGIPAASPERALASRCRTAVPARAQQWGTEGHCMRAVAALCDSDQPASPIDGSSARSNCASQGRGVRQAVLIPCTRKLTKTVNKRPKSHPRRHAAHLAQTLDREDCEATSQRESARGAATVAVSCRHPPATRPTRAAPARAAPRGSGHCLHACGVCSCERRVEAHPELASQQALLHSPPHSETAQPRWRRREIRPQHRHVSAADLVSRSLAAQRDIRTGMSVFPIPKSTPFSPSLPHLRRLTSLASRSTASAPRTCRR